MPIGSDEEWLRRGGLGGLSRYAACKLRLDGVLSCKSSNPTSIIAPSSLASIIEFLSTQGEALLPSRSPLGDVRAMIAEDQSGRRRFDGKLILWIWGPGWPFFSGGGPARIPRCADGTRRRRERELMLMSARSPLPISFHGMIGRQSLPDVRMREEVSPSL